MAKDPNDFLERTKTIALKRAGYICSFPGCDTPLVGAHSDDDKVVTISEVSHICGARKAKNNRYDPNMTSEQRSHISNAIALCRNHGKLIDSDEKEYTVAKLQHWKTLHEKSISDKQRGEQPCQDEQVKAKPWSECSLEELKADREYRMAIRHAEARKRYRRLGNLSVLPLAILVVSAICLFLLDISNLYSIGGFGFSLMFFYVLFNSADEKTLFEQRQTAAIIELNQLIKEIEYADEI
ncbi:hypothetical protein [Photobacterium sanguinicancri]|uniref:hypothetical protein n=1 Tax=Photobacterium TaxID=657 RepID=UPI003D1377AC